MIKSFLDFLFKSPLERKIKKQTKIYQSLINNIKQKSSELKLLSDEELDIQIQNIIKYYQELPEESRNFNNINKINEEEIITLFSIIEEVSSRTLNLRPYSVQIMGGLALTQQLIAEMQTGEGKTLTAAFPAIYYSLKTNQSVHIVTANSYLAERDALFMKPLYEKFGLTVNFNFVPESRKELNLKKEVFKANIIYSSASELAIDYLRSSTQTEIEKIYINQKDMNLVIIDECDFILLDSAKESVILAEAIPFDGKHLKWARETALKLKRSEEDLLILNKMFQNQKDLDLAQEDVEKLRELEKLKNENGNEINNYQVDDFGNIIKGDFYIDELRQSINFFESAYNIMNESLQEYGHYDALTAPHMYFFVEQALLAEHTLLKDRDYIVKDGYVIMINTGTGRPMPLSRWENGLHQAVEFKEGVAIQDDSKILASITYQSFFNLYKYKAGMTGTAKTEEQELFDVYKLAVFPIPTHKPSVRIDNKELMFTNDVAMFEHVTNLVKERNLKGQPILIGTPNIQVSENLATHLTNANITFNLLNAKNLKNEAKIISEAGKSNSVTISTNMSGRGTDIILGGDINSKLNELNHLLKSGQINEAAYEKRVAKLKETWEMNYNKVVESGGLLVICVGLNESRRILNQLRGRCGRQGDVGETMTFFSLEDPFLVHTNPKSTIDFTKGQMEKLDIKHTGEIPPQYDLIDWSRISTKSVKMIENVFAQQRKNTLKYESIQNKQRLLFIQLKENIINLSNDEVIETFNDYVHDFIKLELKSKNKSVTEIDEEFSLYDKQWLIENLIEIIKDLDKTTQQTLKEYSNNIIVDFQNKTLNSSSNMEIIEIAANSIISLHNLRWQPILLLNEPTIQTDFMRKVFLTSISQMWYDYINNMELVKISSQFAVYAKKEPFYEFSNTSHTKFMELLDTYSHRAIKEIFSEPMVDELDINKILKHMKENNINTDDPEEIMKFLDTEISPILFQNEVIKALNEQTLNIQNK